jgi:hypothetical protein
MVSDDEVRAYKRRADAGMLRIADAERLLTGLLAARMPSRSGAHSGPATRTTPPSSPCSALSSPE